MTRPAASLTAVSIRRPRRDTEDVTARRRRSPRWQEDLRWFLWAWAAGFVVFAIFIA